MPSTPYVTPMSPYMQLRAPVHVVCATPNRMYLPRAATPSRAASPSIRQRGISASRVAHDHPRLRTPPVSHRTVTTITHPPIPRVPRQSHDIVRASYPSRQPTQTREVHPEVVVNTIQREESCQVRLDSPKHLSEAQQILRSLEASPVPSREDTPTPKDHQVLQSHLEPAHVPGGYSLRPPVVKRVVLTGGPGVDKLVCKQFLQEICRKEGILCFIVPDVEELLREGGSEAPDASNCITFANFHASLIRAKIALEDSFYSIAAQEGGSAVIIIPTGTLDIRASCSDVCWRAIQEMLKMSEMGLLHRYDHVLHLAGSREAALSQEEDVLLTSKDSNLRQELAVLRSWQSHHSHHVIHLEEADGMAALKKISRHLLCKT